MIVVVIVGLIYSMAITGLRNFKEKKTKITLADLPQTLKNIAPKSDLRYVCIDRCKKCLLLVDGEVANDEFAVLVDDDINVYQLDPYSGSREYIFTPYFDKKGREQDVCFSFEVYKDGSFSKMILEYKNKFYDYYSPLSKVKVYDELQDVIKAKEELLLKVTNWYLNIKV